ncbi:hypothetical protein NDU88_001866 [Pleurodeles waltl]|uniref:Uncharacterized protein n=1 Tax=Pleurodeles waltl TaxID=8319 RepID=A0AAV7SA70_PLEWA|nr:hypothetical protein NDU88_001866 [Pleurodeles waltl]
MSHGLRSGLQVRGVVQGASVSVLSTNGSGNPCTQHVFISPPPFFVVFLFMCASASSGGGEVASEHEGAASHMAMAGHATDSDFTSETEGEGSSTVGTRAEVSGSDSSSEGSSLVVAATSVPPATTGTAATQRTSTALPAAPQPSPRARSPRKVGISFAPGTSGPAPVNPAALSEEVIDLMRTIIVGQSTLLNAIQGVEREVHRSNAYLEGIHSGQAAHQRSFNALASALTAAIVPVSSLPPPTSSTQTQSPVPLPIPDTPSDQPAHTSTPKGSSSRHKHHASHKHSRKQHPHADIPTATASTVSPSSSSPSSLPVTSPLTLACTTSSATTSITSTPTRTLRTRAVTTPTTMYTSPVSSPSVSVTPSSKPHKRKQPPTQQPSTSRQPPAQAPAPKDTRLHTPTTTSSSSTPIPTTPTRRSLSKLLFLANLDLFPTTPPPRPSHKTAISNSNTTKPGPIRTVVQGLWSPPPSRATTPARSQGTPSPPPEKHPKVSSARRERPRTPGTKIPTLAPSGSGVPPGTPPKVSKGHRRPGKGGKGSTPDK